MHTTLGTYVEQISKKISWWKKVNLFNKRFGETRHSCVEKWNSIHISLLLSKNSSLSGINIELWNFKVARRKHRTLKIKLKAIAFWKKKSSRVWERSLRLEDDPAFFENFWIVKRALAKENRQPEAWKTDLVHYTSDRWLITGIWRNIKIYSKVQFLSINFKEKKVIKKNHTNVLHMFDNVFNIVVHQENFS